MLTDSPALLTGKWTITAARLDTGIYFVLNNCRVARALYPFTGAGRNRTLPVIPAGTRRTSVWLRWLHWGSADQPEPSCGLILELSPLAHAAVPETAY